MAEPDGLIRLGYAGGSRTHQRDFAQIASVLSGVLRDHPQCRLVLFRTAAMLPLVELEEFPALQAAAGQIEWRELVSLPGLPEELARFDINLAPLQLGNPFCEAKSELKYFEAAVAGVCTIASPTGPYARAIRDGVTGFLAAGPAQWDAVIRKLLADAELRQTVARAALNEVLWTYGPDRRAQMMHRLITHWRDGSGDLRSAIDGFVLELPQVSGHRRVLAPLPKSETVLSIDHLGEAAVTVVIPLYNYEQTVIEALESVRQQTLYPLDLVIVDDASTDASLERALDWVRAHPSRFNRVQILRNLANSGLAATRNAAFSAAETPYVLPLDPDNSLRPRCCEALLTALDASPAAYAYPVIQEYGGRTGLIGAAPFDPSRLIGGNFIDAMALVRKSAWSAVGGYEPMSGWEDYDFWCAMTEMGLAGLCLGGEALADYRVHEASMLHQVTDQVATKQAIIAAIQQRHAWVRVTRPVELPSAATPFGSDGTACLS